MNGNGNGPGKAIMLVLGLAALLLAAFTVILAVLFFAGQR